MCASEFLVFAKQTVLNKKTGCLEWAGPFDGNGYGKIRINKRYVGAHRWAFELFHHPIRELWVLHRCDNPKCVNPEHLWLGTADDNAKDRKRKGRNNSRRGVATGTAKITENDVVRILNDPRSSIQVAPDYGLSPSHIRKIRQGGCWGHLKQPQPEVGT